MYNGTYTLEQLETAKKSCSTSICFSGLQNPPLRSELEHDTFVVELPQLLFDFCNTLF